VIHHTVMFRWDPSVTPADLGVVAAALDRLPAEISAIASYRHGPDLGSNPDNFDYAIVAEFASGDDFATYRDHPVHRQFIADHITGRVVARAAVQFES
jgi:hypothetical protein